MPDAAARLAGALGLARRAGALLWGTDRVRDAVRAGKARLVLLTGDASPRTRRHFTELCAGGPPCRAMPLPSAALAHLSPRPATVFACTSADLARLCLQLLPEDTQPSKEETAHGF